MLEQIRLTLEVRAKRVISARLSSSRRTQATTALAGKPLTDGLRLLPHLFPLCSRAQQIAGVRAVETALPSPLGAPHDQARRLVLEAEILLTHARALWIEGAELLEAEPNVEAYAHVHGALVQLERALYPAGDMYQPGGGALTPARSAVEDLIDVVTRHVQPEAAPAHVMSLDALERWAREQPTWGARLMARMISQGWIALSPSQALASELPPEQISARLADEPGFAARPTLVGQPVEVGPLAAQRHNPLVAWLVNEVGPGLGARHWARLVCIKEAVERLAVIAASLGSQATTPRELPPKGDGIGWAPTARGPLLHQICWHEDRVVSWHRVAPTEWTLHPDGVATLGAQGWPQTDFESLARFHLYALDPCVPFEVKVISESAST